jgi:hypothetical protein
VRDWLAVITRINPLTCAVDLLRNLVFALQDMPLRLPRGSPPASVVRIHIADCPGTGHHCPFAAALLTLAVTGLGKPG